MATYKVIQDIEAEDKFVGPLTLKQFVFAMGGTLFGYLNVFAITKGAAWMMIIFLPPALFGFFMAIPWNKDQPTDVWVLAKIRFRLKPKKRIWNQVGVQELVTITAPKKVEKALTKNLSQSEVKSRLKALAETIDSRGWAVKNAPLQTTLSDYNPLSDRLVSPQILPQQVPELDDATVPDMLEDTTMDSLIQKRGELQKAQAVDKMDRVRHGEKLEDINEPEVKITPPSEIFSLPKPNSKNEQKLSASLRAKKTAGDIAYGNLSSIPSSKAKKKKTTSDDDDKDKKTGVKKAQASMTEQIRPDIIGLARNNDLNVATIARQANSDSSDDDNPSEVVIPLR